MRIANAFKNASQEIGSSIRRFPLTVLFLIAFTFLNAQNIEEVSDNYARYLFAVLIGVFVSGVGQLIYERFYSSKKMRGIIMAIAIAITVVYYFVLGVFEEVEISLYIRTIVALFALFIAFIWIPTIKNERVAFHQSFLSAFKALVTTVVFTGVLVIGVVLIFQAIHFLLFELDENILWHLLNFIGSLFAPLYFLALTPDYRERESNLAKYFAVPVLLDRLLSYIIIPLLSIYSLVLIAYIFLNIGENFWTDNLMEPLLVSYALIGIIVLLLTSNVNTRISTLFQKVFPKIFLPIVIFQTLASVLKIREMGITHGRYYVILFGLFAIIASLLFSLNRPRHYGWLAVALLVLAAISITPPVDAFSVSKRNQIQLFEDRAAAAGLVENNQIVPNSNVSLEDQVALTELTTYLTEMGYTDEVDYLPEGFEAYDDFSQTFGFEMTYAGDTAQGNIGKFAYSENEFDTVLEIQEDDLFTRQYVTFNKNEDGESLSEVSFTVDENYRFARIIAGDRLIVEVADNEENELISVNASDLFESIFENNEEVTQITIASDFENATFIEENEQVRIKMLLISLEDTPDYYSADFYLFIDIK